MRYEDIPTLQAWKSDAYSIHSPPLDPLVSSIDDMIQKYHQAFSPMAKRNLLADLEKACAAWKPPKPRNPAMEALLDVVKRKLAYSSSVAHTYDKVVCISYSVKTGAFDAAGKVKYQGRLDDEQDMAARVRDMKVAISQAWDFVPSPAREDSKTLKIFMAPEFYFRGRYGAYPPEIVANIMPLLRSGDNGSGRPIFNDWLFVFGTAISAAIDARQYCFTCQSGQNIVFERDPANPRKTLPKCSKGPAHNVKEGIYGAVIDNVALIQKGKEDYLVAKEFISGIDFRDTGAGAHVWLADKGGREKFKPIATEGSSESRFASRFADERMGGGVFNFDGITFGMEICLDHAEEKLKGAGNLQVLLIPSAGMDISKNFRTINEGITFNVDGLRADGKVMVRSGAGVLQPGTSHAVAGAPGNIEVFGPMALPYA